MPDPKSTTERGHLFRTALGLPNASTAWVSFLAAGILIFQGCATDHTRVALPVQELVVRDQLVVHSDFHVPKRHRLLDELTARRHDISELLNLPTSDEPINIYLFKKGDEFREYMRREHPKFPDRRAFFLKNDTTLTVLAYWGDRVGEDLRHEVTHGYLHSVVPNLPLWLDEGIAEYFETPRGKNGLNTPHIYHLVNAFRRGDWTPDLPRLETLIDPSTMTQMDYAESWLWVHFMMESDSYRQLMQDQLSRLRLDAESKPISVFVESSFNNAEEMLVEHLKMLGEELDP